MKRFKIYLLISAVIASFTATAQNSQANYLLPSEARELHIQQAIGYRAAEQYAAAIVQLDSILATNAQDAGALLFKGDLQLQSNLFSKAVVTYQQLLPLNFESTIVRINLSYALFMNHQPAKALQFARLAWEKDSVNTNAIVNYFNALLWNVKTKAAGNFLSQQQALLSPAQVLVLKARLFTTSGDYQNGLKCYDSLVKSYPNKYYVQEYAEVLLGKKEFQFSQAAMKGAERLFTANEYNAYRNKLKAMCLQEAGTDFVYFKDVANNVRIENSVWWQQQNTKRISCRLSAGWSNITAASKEKTNTQFGHVTLFERWNKAWSGQTDVHLQLIRPTGVKSFSGITGKQTLQYQPNDRRMIGITFSTDILNYTAALLGKNIRSNSVGLVTHLMLSGKSGLYAQGSWGVLNDQNQYQQIFGSLYHLFRTAPTLKTGVNFSAVHYKDNTIKTYFSPSRYLSTESFVEYSTNWPMLPSCYFQLQAAAGLQKIEQQQWDPAFRLQTEIGVRLKRLETSIKYQTSNVASSSGTGYQFNWYTWKFIWKW